MTKPDFSLENFLAAMVGSMAIPSLDALGSAHRDVVETFADLHPVKLATTFGGLLTVPELQCNNLRLEALVHLALAHARGKRKPPTRLIDRAFAAIGKGQIGSLEDPAEDVFVSSVGTSRGNFRFLEGAWESAGFFLQRFVNVLEGMPTGDGYDDIRESVFALLGLSDLACSRVGLARWQSGNTDPLRQLPPRVLEAARRLQGKLTFSLPELRDRGIAIQPLSAFIFDPRDRKTLTDEKIGHTTLERYPVLLHNDDITLALPTATSCAIRRFVIERIDAAGIRMNFVRALDAEYANTFARTPLLGGKVGVPLQFQRTKTGVMAGAMTRVDTGRYLNLVFLLDTLDGFETTGLIGANNNLQRMESDIAASIMRATETAEQKSDFQEGVTVIIDCGVGRGFVGSLPTSARTNWRQEFVSAADVCTIGWMGDFKPLSLWRLLEAEEKVRAHNVELQNINGLLNLAAWQRKLRGHLVPHGQLPDDFVGEVHSSIVMIDQTSLKGVREEVAQNWDPHVVLDVGGRWIPVRREARSIFAEDASRPSYVAEDSAEGRLPRGVYEAPSRPWWCEIVVSAETPAAMAYERWKLVDMWLARLAPVLDADFGTLPPGPVLWRVEFEANLGDHLDDLDVVGLAAAKDAIRVEAVLPQNTVVLHVSAAFERAHFNVENVAERALVERTVEGFAELAGTTLDSTKRETLFRTIIPGPLARQTHAFRARGFRDQLRDQRRPTVFIDEDDDAVLRLGLGWRVRDRKLGGEITGKEACTRFLNDVVRLLEDELCADLRSYSRTALIRAALTNYENAAYESDQWRRTAAAVIALHDDKEATFATIAHRDSCLSAVSQTTRTLIEAALCECPLDGGRESDQLGLTRLMAKVALIITLGGWSDAIWLDATEPRLKITALGDIHLDHSFVEDIVTPFGRAASDARTRNSAENYAENLKDIPHQESIEPHFEKEFLQALEEELGTGLDEARLLIDYIENLAIEGNSPILVVPRSNLQHPTVEGRTIAPERAAALIEALTLRPRTSWREVPVGYEERDRQPWRFRRRLSMLRKPLLQVDDQPDPTIMVAPGILRESYAYTFGKYYRGDFPQRQLKPLMRSWRGKATSQRGAAFNKDVAVRLREFGWEARHDVNVSTILGTAYRRYGDIDVLAWNSAGGRILLVECKDLLFGKTFGEIAEQLADFRGQNRRNGDPDDLLRHLNRIELLQHHLPELASHLKLKGQVEIVGHLVFKNPVPMQFAWRRMRQRVHLHIFDDLEDLRTE